MEDYSITAIYTLDPITNLVPHIFDYSGQKYTRDPFQENLEKITRNLNITKSTSPKGLEGLFKSIIVSPGINKDGSNLLKGFDLPVRNDLPPPKIIEVPSYMLPSGDGFVVYGLYNPHINIAYVDKSLPPLDKKWVAIHEYYHYLGHGEQGADDGAASIMGYYLR